MKPGTQTFRTRATCINLAVVLLFGCTAANADPKENLFAIPGLEQIEGDEPGCAVSLRQQDDLRHFFKGQSNLEHSIQIDSSTVFEAGSVAKQFTAAATMLLVLDGRLKLEDTLDEYFPELPGYSEQISIQMLINHTSGLRDWGTVAAIGGAARGTRIFSSHDVLAILSRQLSLNHEPGEFFSYTNSGYSLLAILVERVSGVSFEEFTQSRLFEPLNMSQTSWRTRFNEIVSGRATAYKPVGTRWESMMPFENVVGNGGLLTTTSDLLKFSRALHYGGHFDPAFKELMYVMGEVSSQQPMSYASGIFFGEFAGRREIFHGGSTAGYRAYLADYPDEELSIAVLCNRADARTKEIVRGLAKQFFALANEAEAAPTDIKPELKLLEPSPETKALEGGYQFLRTGQIFDVVASGDSLALMQQMFVPAGQNTFVSQYGSELQIDVNTNLLKFTNPDGVVFEMKRFEPWGNTELTDYVGAYESAESLTRYVILMRDGHLVLVNHENPAQLLVPTHRDQFLIEPTKTRLSFNRDQKSRVISARLSTARVWNMEFTRLTQGVAE